MKTTITKLLKDLYFGDRGHDWDGDAFRVVEKTETSVRMMYPNYGEVVWKDHADVWNYPCEVDASIDELSGALIREAAEELQSLADGADESEFLEGLEYAISQLKKMADSKLPEYSPRELRKGVYLADELVVGDYQQGEDKLPVRWLKSIGAGPTRREVVLIWEDPDGKTHDYILTLNQRVHNILELGDQA